MSEIPSRRFFLAASVLLPWRLRSMLYRHMLGWSIHPTARVGFSIIDAERVILGRGSRIGHLTVIRGLTHLELGAASTIGNWNWLSTAPMFEVRDRQLPGEHFRGLRVGAHSSITSRHYLDCSGGITIGEFTTLGGVRSTVLSHSIDVASGVQTTQPVQVGDRCFVSSNVSLTPGSYVPPRSLVAMGAVVVGELTQEGALYAGVPARAARTGLESGAYFIRKTGFVGLRAEKADELDS